MTDGPRGGLSLWDRGPPPPCPRPFNLARHALWAGQPEDQPALVVCDGAGAAARSFTYAQLRAAVATAAGGLRAAGLARGDRLMLRVGDEPLFPILFLAAAALGAVPAPTSAMLTAGEAGALAARLQPRLVALGDGLDAPEGPWPLLRGDALAAALEGPAVAPVDAAPDDLAYIVFTSGASGAPKGVMHAHRAVWARRMMWTGWCDLRAGDRMLHAGAFNWTYTLGVGLLDPWGAGATALVYAGPRDPAVWGRIAAAQAATHFAATPGVYRQFLKSAGRPADMAGLRCALSAGEALPPALALAWTQATGVPVFEALGMSELSTFVSASPADPPRPGWAGPPQPGRRVAVLGEDGAPTPLGEEGVLAADAADPGLMLGYLDDPAATAATRRGPWFVTGDRAVMDADGHVAHRGRADDLMTAGGYRVAPAEVEAVLLRCPGVVEAAVAERAVRPDVRVVAAYVVAPGLDAATLEAWCAARLAAYKRPRLIRLVEALPRTATGKIIRRQLDRL